MIKPQQLGIVIVIFASALLCGCKDDSGSALVKPNAEQANRYKKGNRGMPPGANAPEGATTSTGTSTPN